MSTKKERRRSVVLSDKEQQFLKLFKMLSPADAGANEAEREELVEEVDEEVNDGLTETEREEGLNDEDGGGEGVAFDPLRSDAYELLETFSGKSLDEISESKFVGLKFHSPKKVAKLRGNSGYKTTAFEFGREIIPKDMPLLVYQLITLLGKDAIQENKMLQVVFKNRRFVSLGWVENQPYKSPEELDHVYYMQRKQIGDAVLEWYYVGAEHLAKMIHESMLVGERSSGGGRIGVQRSRMSCGIGSGKAARAHYGRRLKRMKNFASKGGKYHDYLRKHEFAGKEAAHSDSYMHGRARVVSNYAHPSVVYPRSAFKPINRAKFNGDLEQQQLEDETKYVVGAVKELMQEEGKNASSIQYLMSESVGISNPHCVTTPIESIAVRGEDQPALDALTAASNPILEKAESDDARAYLVGTPDAMGAIIIIDDKPEEVEKRDEEIESEERRALADVIEVEQEERAIVEEPAIRSRLLIIVPEKEMFVDENKNSFRSVRVKHSLEDYGSPGYVLYDNKKGSLILNY